ncbi:MAG: amidohydrolase family protein [Armatimonadetes bacterium]|nr:amidohydrolase family protein [Armatimonadota bacterium]
MTKKYGSRIVALTPGEDGLDLIRFDTETGEMTDIKNGEPEGVLVPGFVDIHFHGAYGIDFMSATKEQMSVLCKKLAGDGYEGFLPTTVTAPASDVKKALANLPADPMVLGFHLEGPFISPKYPGAQPKEFIIDPPTGSSEWDEILDDRRLRVVTLAPERPGALDLIRRLAKRKVIASMGHTDATYEEAEKGHEAGLRHSTHTFNAMRGFHHREAGAAGAAMTLTPFFAELIYDRIHVSPEAAMVLIQTRLVDGQVIAVSDSTMASGLEPGTKLKMWELDCVVGEGDVRLADGGNLAGSAITLRKAFENLTEDFGVDVAADLCCYAPREALRIKGHPRKWNLVDENTGELLASFDVG